jgi:hypothetical protein
MRASIVVPTHKHLSDCLRPCLESIIKNTDLYADVEVIVVANGCGDDGTREYVESLGASFKLIWLDEAAGYTHATNVGLAAATGDALIVANNDVIIQDFQAKNMWLDRLLEPFKDPTVGMTGPLKIRDEVTGYDFLVFCLAAFSRELYNKLGPLDEVFSPGAYEDVDYCLKAERLGYQVLMIANQQGVDRQRGLVVTDYPLYHRGETTVMDAEHLARWEGIKAKNARVLRERWPALPEGSFSPLDVAEYRRLANEVPDGGTICELGVWKGRSLCSIAGIIKRKRLKVIAVDTFQGSVDFEPEKLIARNLDLEGIFRANMQKFGIDPAIHRMTGDEASQLMEDRSIDLLFIDANHGYAAVKNDLERWEPKVRGVIGGHDYNGPMYPNPSWPGVKRAVDERYRDIHYDGVSLVWSRKL